MKKEILIDRSRYETSLDCERKFYWGYLYNKWGIQTKGTPSYFTVGEAVHVGVQQSMLGYDWDTTKAAINGVFSPNITLTDGGQPLCTEAQVEQRDLATALAYVWRKRRLAQFHQEYRVLSLATGPAIEQEITVPIYENEQYIVKLMSRPDVIVERVSDGAIMIWELKTTGVANDQWLNKWEHAFQLMLQVRATEQLVRSAEITNPVVGIVVEGLVKGMRKRDSFGVKRQSNSLIYSYVKRGDGFIIKDQFSHVWKKGLTKELVSLSMPLEQWIDALPEEVLQEHVRVVPPILADSGTVDSVCRQVGARAVRMAERAEAIASMDGETFRIGLDEMFPQNFNSCHAYDRCQFADICFMQSIGEDPLGSGMFDVRTPNHKHELDVQSGTAAV